MCRRIGDLSDLDIYGNLVTTFTNSKLSISAVFSAAGPMVVCLQVTLVYGGSMLTPAFGVYLREFIHKNHAVNRGRN